MLDELLAHPGVEEECVLRSRFGFLAFHGGSLERMTDTIAAAAAEASGASLYAVRQPPDLRWHIPSAEFDPRHSAALGAFLEHVEVAVAVHGYGRPGRFTSILLGGRHRELASHTASHLRPALPDYDIVDALDAIPAELRGLNPANPVNRPPAAGVQLELPPRVRGLGPWWDSRPFNGCSPHTAALIDGLIAAVRSWPLASSR
jgi:phage replication-related protein YjqB (UPF0714/DUF867 family)